MFSQNHELDQVLIFDTVKSPNLFISLAFIRYCIETVRVTHIMRVDLCGISQQFLTIKWDIPQDPFIEAHSELQEEEFIISRPLTVESHQSLIFCVYILLIYFSAC